jgi:AcrR family transcriptional regulator
MTIGRSQRRKLQLREDILSVAHELFACQGVSATTIEDICSRADIANRTFFNHFANRRELMQALADRQFGKMYDALDARPALHGPTTITAFFEAFAAALVGSADTHRELSAALINAARYRGSRGTDLHARAVELVKHGAAQRDITSDQDPEILADIITGTLMATTAQWATTPTFSLTQHLHCLAVTLTALLAPAPAIRSRATRAGSPRQSTAPSGCDHDGPAAEFTDHRP